MQLITRAISVATPAIALVVTWLKIFRHWREARRLRMELTVSDSLLREGEPYCFIVLRLLMSLLRYILLFVGQ